MKKILKILSNFNMGMLIGQIRVLALLILKKDNKVLVCPGFDKTNNADFFRLIGGGIDFGENSLEALKREVKEELDVELINFKLVKVLENIFTYDGNKGHEISFVYEADFKDASNYEKQAFPILDSKKGLVAVWVELSQENIEKIKPEGVANLF
jgi:ADP-ribose pyrophosphatase YjhB (NUDIX family)